MDGRARSRIFFRARASPYSQGRHVFGSESKVRRTTGSRLVLGGGAVRDGERLESKVREEEADEIRRAGERAVGLDGMR